MNSDYLEGGWSKIYSGRAWMSEQAYESETRELQLGIVLIMDTIGRVSV